MYDIMIFVNTALSSSSGGLVIFRGESERYTYNICYTKEIIVDVTVLSRV